MSVGQAVTNTGDTRWPRSSRPPTRSTGGDRRRPADQHRWQLGQRDNSSPGTHACSGRIAVGLGATKRVYAGDDGGTMWAIDPTTATTFGGATLWSFNTGNAIKSSPYWDNGTDTVQYGTQGGTIIVLTGSGAS